MRPLPAVIVRVEDGDAIEGAIREAPAYVLTHDTVWSDAGIAEGRTVVNVLPCVDREQAQWVLRYAIANPYEARPRIVESAPEPNDSRVLVVFDARRVRHWADCGRSTMLAPETPRQSAPRLAATNSGR